MSSKKSFAQLTASLYFIYDAMEGAFGQEDAGAAVKAMDFPSLRRLESIERDMEYYYGTSWRSTVRPSPAARAYVARIKELGASEDPKKKELLVAHQYTRYLGDLFGGQMMAGMATKSLGLDEGQGVAFYDFPDIDNNKEFIEEWYAQCNSLPFSEVEKAELVDEANLVFKMNIAVFEELEGSAAAAVWSFVASTFLEKSREANPVLRGVLGFL